MKRYLPASLRALRSGPVLLACWFGLAAPLPAEAQSVEDCGEGRISRIFIDPHSVFDLTEIDRADRFGWAYRVANRLHVRTREEVVERELLFGVGACYDAERIRDSERLLRELPFIADVDVFGIRQPDGTVHVVVDTQDEWSTRVSPRFGSGGLTGLSLREQNLLGTGQQVSAFYRADEEEQVYGLSYETPQLLGTRWDAAAELGRTPVGYQVAQSLTYPFVGQVGRWGLREGIRRRDRYFEYHLPGSSGLVAAWYPERRQSFEAGVAHRWGTRGYRRTVLGAAIAGEWVSYHGSPRFADEALQPELSSEPPHIGRDSVSSVRALLLAGRRNVYFTRRRRLDSVNGTEDVRLGVEGEVGIGPSLPGISRDRDLVVDLALFAGSGFGAAGIAGLDLMLEARRSYDTPAQTSEWSDVFGRLHTWVYRKPSRDSRHTTVATVAAAGGWHDRVPFQLTLGAETGLRGYRDHLAPGGRRIVASIEHRTYLGWPLPDLFDLGAAAFVDIGKIWAGDAPYGVTTPVHGDVGLGLRAALPPGSRRTARLDLAMPLTAGVGPGDLRISIGMRQLVGRSASDLDSQMRRSMRVRPSNYLFGPGERR